MPRFFVLPEQINGNTVVLTGEDARHISFSLRMRQGEHIVVCDGEGSEYDATLSSFDGQSVTASLSERRASETEFPFRIRLCQSVPKGDKLETIVQKATELGVTEIVPVFSARCIVQPDERGELKKRERLAKIAREAAMQCGRGRIPTVAPSRSFAKALADGGNFRFICYENERAKTLRAYLEDAKKTLAEGDTISFFVGPEGGYAPEEIARAEQAGVHPVGLGARILRCETASAFVLSCMEFAFGKK